MDYKIVQNRVENGNETALKIIIKVNKKDFNDRKKLHNEIEYLVDCAINQSANFQRFS